ncbi:D-glycero-alpha-D-manno-heptose-1,7-bisphosphate 7-phosphatase [Halalkalibacter oceani]|uniref:D,D-heptose 1,7-bisphosphate phosphatase n=1 Tax=Halalkalibacter oceani TaxID=1653776 RepID=A0A9X2DMG2_9BACI|nr:HAD family hydrolase [Halalkalibacter oceani]MCM3713501.1 HAD family hydrolase [Halalkalibacter oceani]MCM3761320.1 HAD family hydrolase [Halalkalibacter oceani]
MRQAVFLDRDGVINEVLSKRVRFVNRPSHFFLLDGVGEAIHLLNRANWPVFVVTNQGGVGLGYMSEASLQEVHQEMIRQLAAYEARITAIAYCAHAPHAGCACRKPGSKMLEDLAVRYDVDLAASVMVGDRQADIEAGKKAGCTTIGIGQNVTGADAHFPSLRAAVPWILSNT